MTDKINTNVLAKNLGVSPPTIKRLVSNDSKFPAPHKIGRENYFDADSIHEWLKSRCSNPKALQSEDKVISGARILELTGRSKAWFWLHAVKPKKLTRINLSPDPKSNKLINNFIEREVYEAFGDLIEVAGMEGAE